ncbi:hypothetical protein AAC387_Pa08g2124 [Persea americana]
MEKKVIIICFLVGFLGLLTAALGFAAEAKRIKVSDVTLTPRDTCSYPRSPALALGSIAGLALVIAQIIISSAAGCICCKKHPVPSRSNWTVALVCFIVSWITFVLAFLLLLTGAALNDEHAEEKMYFGYCYVVKPGVFSGGAVLSLVTVSLGIIYYLIVSSTKHMDPWGAHQNQGIALAQPQFPPPNTQPPVFVHEDTYNRRQFP